MGMVEKLISQSRQTHQCGGGQAEISSWGGLGAVADANWITRQEMNGVRPVDILADMMGCR